MGFCLLANPTIEPRVYARMTHHSTRPQRRFFRGPFLPVWLLIVSAIGMVGCGGGSSDSSVVETDELSRFMNEHPELDREPMEVDYDED